MDIIIAERLRELRRKRGNTQEDLADFLQISLQSVSKWETGAGMPDITLLPKIAAYYDVTLDDLFGIDEIRKKERIEWYSGESMKLYNVGKIPEAVALWREALKEFPNDHTVISQLANAIFYQCTDDKEHFKAVIELGERILRESTEQDLRDSAIQLLCYSYNYLGDAEKAKEYANMGGDMFCSRQILLSSVLQGEECENYNKRLIADCVDVIEGFTCKLKSIPWEVRHEFYLKLLETLFDDGFMGFYATRAAHSHHCLARIYAGWENADDKVKYHLEQLVKYAKQYDCLNGEYTYTCTMLKGLTSDSNKSTTNTEGTRCENYLEALTDGDSWMFDKFRETDWFKAVISSLEKN